MAQFERGEKVVEMNDNDKSQDVISQASIDEKNAVLKETNCLRFVPQEVTSDGSFHALECGAFYELEQFAESFKGSAKKNPQYHKQSNHADTPMERTAYADTVIERKVKDDSKRDAVEECLDKNPFWWLNEENPALALRRAEEAARPSVELLNFFGKQRAGPDCCKQPLRPEVITWVKDIDDLGKFHDKRRHLKYTEFMSKMIEFEPKKVIQFAMSCYATDAIFEDFYCYDNMGKFERFVKHLITLCVKPLTPDMHILIDEMLSEQFDTVCVDTLVNHSIFGEEIIPKCRRVAGEDAWSMYTRDEKRDVVVYEFMKNRQIYEYGTSEHHSYSESDDSLRMRDIMNEMLKILKKDEEIEQRWDLQRDETMIYNKMLNKSAVE